MSRNDPGGDAAVRVPDAVAHASAIERADVEVAKAVAPMRNPRAIWSVAAQIESAVRWKPNIE